MAKVTGQAQFYRHQRQFFDGRPLEKLAPSGGSDPRSGGAWGPCLLSLPKLVVDQFDLLAALAERAGRVLTRDQIMEAVRGRELDAFDRSIDVHMGRIRAAIEVDAKTPKRILTVRGVGYVFARLQD